MREVALISRGGAAGSRRSEAENRILRVAGNPYHPLATTRPAAMETPVREVYAQLGGDNGLEGRVVASG